MLALRERIQAEYDYAVPLRVGSGGGISTPHSVAAVFAMGADYVMTGSVNQACREAGTSHAVRQMLAKAEQADVTMAPAADMFEMGVRLQVLKRGTMFPMRAHRLYDLYRTHGGLEDISDDERKNLEGTIFRKPLEEIWNETRRFWEKRDVTQIERAERDPKHRMALVFRWYLGMSSRWANRGRAGARNGLPGMVWPGDGSVQRMGSRQCSRSLGESARRHRGAQHVTWSSGHHSCRRSTQPGGGLSRHVRGCPAPWPRRT